MAMFPGDLQEHRKDHRYRDLSYRSERRRNNVLFQYTRWHTQLPTRPARSAAKVIKYKPGFLLDNHPGRLSNTMPIEHLE
jgi:hypothetical protein